jgi:plasmid stability protein
MSSILQIRNVPKGLYRRLKARAAHAGISISEYALLEIRKELAQPTRGEILERLSKLSPPVRLDPPPADVIRAERDCG